MKAKLTIDKNIYIVDLFEANGLNLSVDIHLTDGMHTLTKVEIFDGDNIIHSKEMLKEFTLTGTFPEEIALSFGGNKSFSIRAVGDATAPLYLAIPKDDPLPEQENVGINGILGVPTDDVHFYQGDDVYKHAPITNKIKLRLAVNVNELNEDGSINDNNKDVWFMYNWGEPKPINVKWNKPIGNNTIVFTLQFYYAYTDDKGNQRMADVNMGINGDWTIRFKEKSELVTDANDVINISFMPNEDWLSNAGYKFYYPVYD